MAVIVVEGDGPVGVLVEELVIGVRPAMAQRHEAQGVVGLDVAVVGAQEIRAHAAALELEIVIVDVVRAVDDVDGVELEVNGEQLRRTLRRVGLRTRIGRIR
ncbi:hypothetical protein D3C72_1440080 [compost metagenome]